MLNKLVPGDVRVGRLFDGVDDNVPDQAAALHFHDRWGTEVAVPYYFDGDTGRNPQYAKTRDWFKVNGGNLPKTLIFEDDKGYVTLTGVHSAGFSGAVNVVGRCRAQAAIFEKPIAYQEEYSAREFLSCIDGLSEFALFVPVEYSQQRGKSGSYTTTVTIEARDSVEWAANGYEYAIQSNVSWSATQGRRFVVEDSSPFIRTVSESGSTLSDHLAAHRPVRALLSLVYGQKLAWRSHKLLDEVFPLWTLDGKGHGPHPVDVLMSATAEQHRAPSPDQGAFAFPAFRLRDAGPEGMKKWVELYSDEVFRQAVQPAVEVINGASRFLEPQLMMLAISLDRFGYFRFGDGRRRSMPEHILECLEAANVDWPHIGSRSGLAQAISNVNNDLKHPDRESYPDVDIMAGVKEIAEIVVRSQVFDLIGLEGELRSDFMAGSDAQNAAGILERAGVSITGDGEFVRL